MRICVFEDEAVERLAPLALTRPAFDLWCGAGTLLQRQMRAFLTTAIGAVVRPELAPLCRLRHPAIAVNDAAWLAQAPAVWVNARWLAPAAPRSQFGRPEVGLVNDQVAYVVPPPAAQFSEMPAGLADQLAAWRRELPCRTAPGRMVDYPWALVEVQGVALEENYEVWRTRRQCLKGRHDLAVTIVGPPERLLVAGSAQFEPDVVVDTTGGPVLVDRQAVVRAFTRLEGPCFVGPRSQVLGACVRNSSVGPACRVGGEVEASILQGFANKAHDGFLGHSVVGEWVNLAAGTQVSDLRTDYESVPVPLGGAEVDTGLLKVGAFVGDYTQTGVGALLNTGTVAGPFAQLLPTGALLPRDVPAFCRTRPGQLQERTDLRQLFATAATAMRRRGCAWTAAHAEFYFDLFERTADCRRERTWERERCRRQPAR